MAAIPTGLMATLAVPWDCRITEVAAYATAGTPGSIQVDIWKCAYNDYNLGPAGVVHPVDADSITGGNEINIVADDKYRDLTLTGWKKDLLERDILAFYVDSCTTIERVTIELTLVTT